MDSDGIPTRYISAIPVASTSLQPTFQYVKKIDYLRCFGMLDYCLPMLPWSRPNIHTKMGGYTPSAKRRLGIQDTGMFQQIVSQCSPEADLIYIQK